MLCFTTVWDTPAKGKVAKWSPAPASILEGLNEIYAVCGPRKPCKTRGKRQSCQIDPCLPPYKGGDGRGGYSHLLASTLSLRAVGPATVVSHIVKCDILPPFEGRPNCARQSLASTLSAPRVAATPCCDPVATQMSLPPVSAAVCLPPVKRAQLILSVSQMMCVGA